MGGKEHVGVSKGMMGEEEKKTAKERYRCYVLRILSLCEKSCKNLYVACHSSLDFA